MTTLTVEVTGVRPAGNGYPWPTVVGTVVHGPRAGDVVRVAAEPYAAEVIAADLAEPCSMPPVVVVEAWQVVAVVAFAAEVEAWQASGRAAAYADGDYRTCDGCGAVEDAGTGPDLDGQGFGPCCTAVTA